MPVYYVILFNGGWGFFLGKLVKLLVWWKTFQKLNLMNPSNMETLWLFFNWARIASNKNIFISFYFFWQPNHELPLHGGVHRKKLFFVGSLFPLLQLKKFCSNTYVPMFLIIKLYYITNYDLRIIGLSGPLSTLLFHELPGVCTDRMVF